MYSAMQIAKYTINKFTIAKNFVLYTKRTLAKWDRWI